MLRAFLSQQTVQIGGLLREDEQNSDLTFIALRDIVGLLIQLF
jgi:aspartyl-tRNA synthetase